MPGAVRRLAEPGAARLGRWARPGRRARPRRRRRRHGVRRRRGGPARLPGRRRLPRRTRSSPSTPPAAGARSCPRIDPRPAGHRRRWCWSTSTASTSARRPTTSRSPRPSTRVAMACSPHRDIAVNPAKMLAIALADANPVVWGGSVLAARAARRVAESIRRASGRTALAGDAEHLLPVIEAAAPRNVFDDPFADEPASSGPCCWCSTTAPTTRRPRAARPAPGGRGRARRTDRDRRRRRGRRGGALRLAAAQRPLRRGVPPHRPGRRLTATTGPATDRVLTDSCVAV